VHPAVLVVLALLPCAILLAYYLRQAPEAPEPWTRVGLTAVVGAAGVGLAFPFQQALAGWFPDSVVLQSFVGFALGEELLKVLAVLIAAPAVMRWDRMSSGLIYGIAAGLGFAALENLLYVLSFGSGTAVLRAITAVPGHALHSALVGIQLGKLHRIDSRGGRIRAVLVGLGLAVLAHGLYDVLLLGEAGGRFGVVPLLALEGFIVTHLFRRARAEDLGQAFEMLRKVPVLEAVPAATIRILVQRGTRRSVRSGRQVVRVGAPGDALFLLQRGTMTLVRDSMYNTADVVKLRPGHFFGEMALVTGSPYRADVTATSDCLLLRIPRLALFEAVQENRKLASALVQTAKRRESERAVMPDTGKFQAVVLDVLDNEEQMFANMGTAARLKGIALLQSLPTSQLETLADVCLETRRGPSRTLVRQGGEGGGMWIIMEGEVEILRNGKVVAHLTAGQFFGEINLLTGWASTATVRSTTPLEAVVLTWADLSQMVGMYPEVGWGLLEALVHRIQDLRNQGLAPSAPTSQGVVAHAVERIVGALGVGRPPPKGKRARALARAYPDLKVLPTAVAESLAKACKKKEGPGPGLWLDSSGTISGLSRLMDEPGTMQLTAVGPVGADKSWYISKDRLVQTISHAPDTLRFLGRMAVRGDSS